MKKILYVNDRQGRKKIYQCVVKRLFDFILSLIALVLVSPVFAVVCFWLKFANKGAGIFFTQDRPGKDGKIFKVIKFKTMTDERDEKGELLPDSERLTKVGRFVRSTSIDELPQLINVLKGDMSLVGPRPLTVDYLLVYTPEQNRRHEVRPGITGWAQVHGRQNCKLSNKFEMDVWYVDHCSMKTDLKIVWMTIGLIIRRSDIGEGASWDIDDLGYGLKIRQLKKQKNEQQ